MAKSMRTSAKSVMSKLSKMGANWIERRKSIQEQYAEKGITVEEKPSTNSHPKRKPKRHFINVKSKRKMTKQSRRANR